MDLIFKRIVGVCCLVFMAGTLMAQNIDTAQIIDDYVPPFSGNHAYRTWSIGAHGGALSMSNVFTTNGKLDFTNPTVQAGFGGFIRKQMTPTIGFQGDLLFGNLSADHSQPTAPGVVLFPHVSTKINYAGSLSLDIALNNISWQVSNTGFHPYFTIGGGLTGFTPKLTLPDGSIINFKDNHNGLINEFYAPIGLGIRIDLASWVNLDLGYQVNFLFADNLDGYNYGQTNDKFSYAHLGFEFVIGNTSNSISHRPKPKLASHNPVASMRAEYLSEIWKLQSKAKTDSLVAVNVAAQKNELDQLKRDLTAANAKITKLTTDSDKDGVPDYFDKCPNTPAGTRVDGSGCPLQSAGYSAPSNSTISERDKKVVKEAINNVEFTSGKARLSRTSFASLNRIANLLIEKKLSLKLAGYTDNIGTAETNIRLSKDRAEAIKIYLVSRGVNPSRIEAVGYGIEQPIASNDTPAGRKLNRRVEFTVF